MHSPPHPQCACVRSYHSPEPRRHDGTTSHQRATPDSGKAHSIAARYREAVQRLVILDVPLEGLGAKSLPPNAPSGTSAFSRLLAAWRNLLPRDVSRSCFSGSSLVLRLQSRQRISRSTFVGILAETPYGPDLGIIARSQAMHSYFKSTARQSYASRS